MKVLHQTAYRPSNCTRLYMTSYGLRCRRRCHSCGLRRRGCDLRHRLRAWELLLQLVLQCTAHGESDLSSWPKRRHRGARTSGGPRTRRQ